MALSTLDNLDRCQMAGARSRVDPVMRALVDQLDDAYYGTPNPDGKTRAADGWRHGVSHPFFIWDYVGGQDNKLKFDLLSGAIHHLTHLAQHAFNCDHSGVNPAATYAKYPEAKYNEIRDANGLLVETRVRAAKRWCRGMATQWNAANLTPVMNRTRWNQIVNYLKNRPAVQELLARRAALDVVFDIDNETDVA